MRSSFTKPFSLERPEELLGEDKAEHLASVCALNGKLWLEAKSECNLCHAHKIANERLYGTLEERFNRYVEEERAQNEDRADIQERNLERHVSKQRETIRGVLERYREDGRTRLIPATEGRLRALDERYKHRKLVIDSRRKVTDRSEDICVAVVLIE